MTLFEDYDNTARKYMIVSVAMCAIAICAVTIRITQALVMRKRIEIDDYMAMASMFLNVLGTILACISVIKEFGRQKPDIHKIGVDLTEAGLLGYLCQMQYKMTLGLNKLCFMFLYLRALRGRGPRPLFRRICIVTIVIVILGTFSFVMVSIFQCLPIRKAWYTDMEAGHCINFPAFRWAWAGFNTVMDVWICFLPIRVVWQLHTDIGKRLGLIFVFALGLFVSVTSAVRMRYLSLHLRNTNQTDVLLETGLWSGVEANVGLICACLPLFKRRISLYVPNYFRPTKTRPRDCLTDDTFEMQRGDLGNRTSVVGGGANVRKNWVPPEGIMVQTDIDQRSEHVNLG